MVSTLTRSLATWFDKWWHSRIPTREAIVVTGSEQGMLKVRLA
jgi:hypothetical protein